MERRRLKRSDWICNSGFKDGIHDPKRTLAYLPVQDEHGPCELDGVAADTTSTGAKTRIRNHEFQAELLAATYLPSFPLWFQHLGLNTIGTFCLTGLTLLLYCLAAKLYLGKSF